MIKDDYKMQQLVLDKMCLVPLVKVQMNYSKVPNKLLKSPIANMLSLNMVNTAELFKGKNKIIFKRFTIRRKNCCKEVFYIFSKLRP